MPGRNYQGDIRYTGADRGHGPGSDGADLKTLLSSFNQDLTQLAHDELELAKLELRDIADKMSSDLKEAGQTLAKDMAKVVVSGVLALLGGLALTTGAVLAVGRLLGGAFWAGGFIVGAILLGIAAFSAMSAGKDMKESDALRMQDTRRALERDKRVMADEARRTKEFVRDEAQEFKRHATPPAKNNRPGLH